MSKAQFKKMNTCHETAKWRKEYHERQVRRSSKQELASMAQNHPKKGE